MTAFPRRRWDGNVPSATRTPGRIPASRPLSDQARYNEPMARPTESTQARTIKEIAAVAGVSKSTVSRVLNDTPGVSPKARELVRTAIEQTGYVPNRAARS